MFQNTLAFAKELDAKDPLKSYRTQFHVPKDPNGKEWLYFCGNSLGLQPAITKDYINQELNDWANLGVEGHFEAKNPWMPYHDFLHVLISLYDMDNQMYILNTILKY